MDSPLHAEFAALLFGLEESKQNITESLIIENDSLMAIREIEIGQESMSEWRGYILDIISVAKENNCCRFCHIRRTANGCAHNMAKLSNELREYKVWRNMPPVIM